MYHYKKSVKVLRSKMTAAKVAGFSALVAASLFAGAAVTPSVVTHASGGSSTGGGSTTTSTGGGTSGSVKVDTIKISKAYTNATSTTGGEMLIKAASSDTSAQLFAYRPDGTLIGQVQNGGGSRYGGTVMPYQSYDPGTITVTSSSGGSTTVATTPFQI